jgi:hypothetical protein
MDYRFKILAFALACTLCLAIPFLGGCTNPNLPDDVTDVVDQPPAPEPPAGSDPDPVPDPLPEPDPPVMAEHTVLIDFQSAVSGIVGEGFAAAGFGTPPGPGQLDAGAWSLVGFSDGDLDFGQEAFAGDFARGISSGGVSTGGLYGFTVLPDNLALGVQPTSTDFAPGSIVLKLTAPSDKLQECLIEYKMWTLNDQDRSTVWSGWYSADGTTWIELVGLGITTPAPADAMPQWSAENCLAVVPLEEVSLGAGDPFYLRWDAADGGGDGSRDESAIDDIAVTFTYEQ